MANNCNCGGTKKVIKTTFLLRRGASEAWEEVNPILAYGEPGYEKDTGQLKIGDGVTPWKELPYIGDGSSPAVINVDNKSVKRNSNREISVFDYENAEIGTVPRKTDTGLEWVVVPDFEEVLARIETLESIAVIWGGNANEQDPITSFIMPDLVNASVQDAESILNTLSGNQVLLQMTQRYNDTIEANHVIEHTPIAGATVELPAEIGIVASLGKGG